VASSSKRSHLEYPQQGYNYSGFALSCLIAIRSAVARFGIKPDNRLFLEGRVTLAKLF
jgi:hypothetical protein